jgi:hypothetical protein
VKDKHTCNYVYNHCNICNIPIYFCNIHLKLLQHTSETLEINTCNMHFQQKLVAGRAEHYTVGSGCAVAVEKEDDSGQAATRPP